MGWLALLIAYFQTNGEDTTDDTWLNLYLDNLVEIREFMFSISWYIVGFVVLIAILIAIKTVFSEGREGFAVSGCAGCFAIFLLMLPLLQWIMLEVSKGMASSVDPTGVVSQGKLVVSGILYFLIGIA